LTGGISCEVIDMPVINPITEADWEVIRQSTQRTGNLLAVDGAWPNCSWAATVVGTLGTGRMMTLPATPAPTSGGLEAEYYQSISAESVAATVREMVGA